jgi:iron complex outermembrane receptor protein
LFKTLLFAGGCSLASAAPAFAQVAQPTAAATVETLIVTAQKREENLQSVPLSVAAISSTTIERLHVRDFKDITGTVPNVQVQVNAGLSLAASYVIRGIGIAANPSPYVGTEVGTVIDGVVLSVNQIALIDNFDLERIEVLRGPQGTLFGANTTGGVINVITAQPTGQFGGYGQVTLGNYSRMDGAFALNFPIIDDVLAGKVSYSHRQRDGYYTNLYTGDPIGGSNSSQLRAYLKWTPEAHLDVTWIGQVQKIRDGTDVLLDIAYPGEIFFRPTTPFAFQLYSNVPDKHNTDTTSNTITANWEGGIGRVTSITNYLTWKSLGYQDIDGIDAPGYAQVGKQDGWQISQELRDLFHPVESVEMLVGLYAQQWGYYSNGQNWPVFSSPTAIGETINKEKTTNLAAFTQVWWDVTDRLRLQGGLRVSYETVRMYEASVSFVQPAGTDPAKGFSNLVGATQLPLNPLNLPTEAEKSWTNVGGKVAADYKITDDVMAYGYYARGFKSGGFNGRVTLAANIGPYNPEYVDSFEAGIKSHWLDNRLRLNIAAFYNNWQDMQVNQVFYRGNPPVGSSTILNAGKSTTKGVELDGEWVPVDGLRINGTLGYLNTYYNVFKQGNGPTCAPPPAIPSPGCSNDYSGRPLVYSPEWNGSLSATYTWAVGGGKADATLQYIYNGDRWGNYTQAPSEFLKAYSLLNANLTWSPAKEHWAISLWGRNLTNEKYLNLALDAPPLFSEGLFGAPREYGIDFRFNF